MRYLRNITGIAALIMGLWSCGEPAGSEQTDPEGAVSGDSLIVVRIEEGKAKLKEGDVPGSWLTFKEAEAQLSPATDTALRITLNFHLSEALKKQGDYETCLINYEEASKLAKLSGDERRFGLACYNKAAVYYRLQLREKALDYNQKAREIFADLQDSSRMADCDVQYAAIQRQTDPEASLQRLKSAIDYYTRAADAAHLGLALNNYANFLYDEEQWSEALTYYRRAARASRLQNNDFSLAIRLGNLGEVFLKQGRLDSAGYYIDASLALARQVKARETQYHNFLRKVELFKQKGRLSEAIASMDSVLSLKTDLLRLESEQSVKRIEDKNRIELELIRMQKEKDLWEKDRILAQQQKRVSYLVAGLAIAIGLLVVLVLGILYFRQKARRKRDLAKHEKEKSRLLEELEFKKQELIRFSVQVQEHERRIQEIRDLISPVLKGGQASPEELQQLRGQVQSSLGSERAELYKKIEELNASFHFRLQKDFPRLSADDIRLSSLLFLGLKSKEIAQVLGIEPKSVDMKKYRLKKKLELSPEQDLLTFLHEI